MARKPRLFIIDIMRIVCAFLIFARHSITMYGCTFGRADNTILCLTSSVMTCFFVISGFSIHYQHRGEYVNDIWIKSFLKKRFISIIPSYFLVCIFWPFIYTEQIKDWLILLPVDLTGTQATYSTLFGIIHNGGTWFVSCLLFCYISYPIIKSVLSSNNRTVIYLMLFIPYFLLLWSNYIIPIFSLESLYSNPIARTGEFMIGASFAEYIFSEEKKYRLCLKSIKNIIFLFATIGCTAIIIAKLTITPIEYIPYYYLPILIIGLLLFLASIIRCEILEKSKIIYVLSSISYQFFLMQLFLWKISACIIKSNNNFVKIIGSLVICVFISYIIWRFIDTPIRKFLNNHTDLNPKVSSCQTGDKNNTETQ